MGVEIAMLRCLGLLLCVAAQTPNIEASAAVCTQSSTKTQTFDCSKTGCCQDKSLTCFLKDHGWGECLASCAKGIHEDDPPEFRTAWSCSKVQSKHGNVLVKEYGQCGGMLAGKGDIPYTGATECEEGCHCLRQDKWVSTCRPLKNGVPCGGKALTRVGNHVVSNEFQVNEEVQAKFAGLWYSAKVDRIHEDGSYTVSWATDNYLTSTDVVQDQLRHRKRKKEENRLPNVEVKADVERIHAGRDVYRSRTLAAGRWAFALTSALMVSVAAAIALKRIRSRRQHGPMAEPTSDDELVEM